MRAVDTNVLVNAAVAGTAHHRAAGDLLRGLAEGAAPWAIPWPCLYEFLRVVTHPRVFHPPMPLPRALEVVEALLQAPAVVVLSETERHGDIVLAVLRQAGVTGNLVHDAHIAALCLEHGVSELLTVDRDFSRFHGLRVRNPFDR